METIDMTGLQGGGGNPYDRDLTLCHSGLDPESISADRNNLRLGGRSDVISVESSSQAGFKSRHSELDSESIILIKTILKDSCSRVGMTYKDLNKHCHLSRSAKIISKAGFTLAEVLITLGIIGIVAAMTLPSLIGNYQKHVTVNKLKKVYTVLSQLVIKAQEDNGPAYFPTSDEIDPAVMINFFDSYWKPYFHSPTVLSEGTFPFEPSNDQKFPRYMYRNNTYQDIAIYTIYRAGRVFFITNDGTAYFLLMVRWIPVYDDDGNKVSDIYKYSVAQTVYADINGVKPPNVIGKDVFMFTVDFDKNIVRANGYDQTNDEINTNCSHSGTGAYCAAKIMQDGWTIADDYPW